MCIRDRVMCFKYRADCLDSGRRWREHEQGGERSMIQAKGCSKGKRLVPVCGASRRKKDLYFHADVAKKPAAELKECGSVDTAGISRGEVKQLLETSMILCEVAIDKPGHEDIV